ncbi:hypothetical protein BDN71DRAFT_1500192 [Pleurotus eryngii]|uniref:Uncharacterized protein n=1 Tax=Pleurotus eryngii TaxID=5323 RepID=A0A9P6D0R2_PLEER|nr:hypothetical protein BDN71DRAFT_1500192 [Pleurotus eryngii]
MIALAGVAAVIQCSQDSTFQGTSIVPATAGADIAVGVVGFALDDVDEDDAGKSIRINGDGRGFVARHLRLRPLRLFVPHQDRLALVHNVRFRHIDIHERHHRHHHQALASPSSSLRDLGWSDEAEAMRNVAKVMKTALSEIDGSVSVDDAIFMAQPAMLSPFTMAFKLDLERRKTPVIRLSIFSQPPVPTTYAAAAKSGPPGQPKPAQQPKTTGTPPAARPNTKFPKFDSLATSLNRRSSETEGK